jgi:predicted Zn-dependent protease
VSGAGPDPLALAHEVLADAVGETQVTVVHERSLTNRFARSVPTQATAVDLVEVHVLCVVDGHTGGATSTALDRDSLRAATRRARVAAEAAARSGPGPYPGLPDPAPVRPSDGVDPATAQLDPATAGEALRASFAAADEHGLQADGMWSAGDVRVAIASSRGVAATDRATDAYLRVICRDGDGRAGFASATGVGVGAIDGAELVHRAAAKVGPGEPATLAPGEYPVVLEHEAVGVLLEQLGALAFNGLAHAEGRGALTGRLGTRVAAPAINLSDAPRFRGTLPRAFDAEGVPKAPLPLLQDGVAHRVVHDTRSAAIAGAGARSTGHALAPGGSAWGPVPTNLVLIGGGAASIDELAAPIERGLYVTRLWYVNPVHERSALVTGVSREGTFLIEDGRITRPLHDVRFTDSVLRILAATEELTAAQRLVSEAEFYGVRFATGTVTPALRAGGFRVTGGA